jgi:2-polyprenyl-3-methyl-5-hydroxy-6-metoxy-1,4-benzoquinol methylase
MELIPNRYFANDVQKEWNEKRLSKILTIFGKHWFKDKRILEVACGRGFFGRELSKLGAIVTFTDARQLFVDALVADGFAYRKTFSTCFGQFPLRGSCSRNLPASS